MQVNLLIRYELKPTITVIKTHFKPIVLYIVPMNYQMCATWERINKCWGCQTDAYYRCSDYNIPVVIVCVYLSISRWHTNKR